MKKIVMIVERTRTGYSAYAEKYGAATTGRNLDELKANMLEALNLYFEEKGRHVKAKDIKVVLDLPQFFEFYRVINEKALSERIGMNQSLLAQYISGRKRPSPSQTERIFRGVRQLGKELAELEFTK